MLPGSLSFKTLKTLSKIIGLPKIKLDDSTRNIALGVLDAKY